MGMGVGVGVRGVGGGVLRMKAERCSFMLSTCFGVQSCVVWVREDKIARSFPNPERQFLFGGRGVGGGAALLFAVFFFLLLFQKNRRQLPSGSCQRCRS